MGAGDGCLLARHPSPIETDVDLVDLVVVSTDQVEVVLLALKSDQFCELCLRTELLIRGQKELQFLGFQDPVFEVFGQNGAIEGRRV